MYKRPLLIHAATSIQLKMEDRPNTGTLVLALLPRGSCARFDVLAFPFPLVDVSDGPSAPRFLLPR